MQATSFAPFPNCCYSIPNHLHFQHLHLKRPKPVHLSLSNNQNHFTNIFALTLIPTIIATKQQEKNNNPNPNPNPNTNSNPNPNPDPNLNPSFVPQFYSCIATNKGNNQNPESQNQGKEEDHRDNQTKKARGIFTNMWWAELKAAMGQRFNFEAIVSSAMVVVKDRHLALPHVAVPDIRYIDWAELHRRGFRGVVFDKDNTITAPYSLNLWGPLRSSLEQCKSVFGPDIAVFSNSAGLCEYDLDGSKARALEGAIGIKVIRHRVKKPAGTAEEIEKHFGCKSSQLIMVGDRPLTDIVYGNRNGFLTILTEPLSLAEEPFIVRQVRKLETSLVNRWFRRGLKPTSHSLLSDAMLCVKALPPS